MTQEHKNKIGLANKGNKSRTGQHQSVEERLKKSISLKGIPKSPGHGKKVSDAQTGVARPNMQLENHPNWKGIYSKDRRLGIKEHLAGRPKPTVCEVCGGGGKIVYDHDHTTGKFRGWLCNGCNCTLGHARDSVEVMYKLIDYLNKSRGLIVIEKKQLSNVPLQ